MLSEEELNNRIDEIISEGIKTRFGMKFPITVEKSKAKIVLLKKKLYEDLMLLFALK